MFFELKDSLAPEEALRLKLLSFLINVSFNSVSVGGILRYIVGETSLNA